MKLELLFISCIAALATSQTNPSNPVATNYEVGSLRRALNDGSIADVCQQFTGYPEELVYENQNCKFPPDDDKSKAFNLCYLSFFFDGNSTEDNCLKMDLVEFISTPDQLELVNKCAEYSNYLGKCCTASIADRREECNDFMNCYAYCAMGCKDKTLCPVGYVLDDNKRRSRQ